YGVTRIVAARELSIKEIRKLRETSGLEVEVFVQGALCYCYSGQCLFSSIIGGRSGNRGRCAQPCRLPYRVDADGRPLNDKNSEYFLSPRDICLLEDIPALCDAGVDSLKIEGRMKGPEYAAVTSYMYRKYVDLYAERGKEGFSVADDDIALLEAAWSRSGFSGGYLYERSGRDMITLESPSYPKEAGAAADRVFAEIAEKDDRIPVKGRFIMKSGEPLRLSVSAGNAAYEAEGPVPEAAVKTAVTAEDALDKISRTGGTDLYFEDLKADCDGGLFVPVKEFKELRRKALYGLEERILDEYRR
ncbi:MAG: U32 family peptidase, partial [Lachnospiraceae bacterium]|nr:U32 family peptidase [Lachnospiraceae bacterium]